MVLSNAQQIMFSKVLEMITKSRNGISPALSLRGCKIILKDLCTKHDDRTLWQHIKDLGHIKHLDLSNNNIGNIKIMDLLYTKVKKFSKVQLLNLSKNHLETLLNIDWLINPSNINAFDASDNDLYDISDINKFSELRSLKLSNNNIKDPSDIGPLINLEYLHLSNNKIGNISKIKGLTNLEYLNLSNNQITNILGLNELKKLKYLDLSNNPITINPLVTKMLLNLGNKGVKITMDSSQLESFGNHSKSFGVHTENENMRAENKVKNNAVSMGV